MLLSRFKFIFFDIYQKIHYYNVRPGQDKNSSEPESLLLVSYLIGTDVIIICTVILVWYYEYREICLVGTRKSALSRKMVQGLRVWFYFVWFFILLSDMNPPAWAIMSLIVAIIDVVVIVLHLKIFCSRTPISYKNHQSPYDIGQSWAKWWAGDEQEVVETKEAKKQRKKREKEAKRLQKEKEARRRKKKPHRDADSDSEYDSDGDSDSEESIV